MRFTAQHLIEARAYASARAEAEAARSLLTRAVLATVEEIEALNDDELTPLPDEDVDLSEFDEPPTQIIPAARLAVLRGRCPPR